MQGAVQAAYPSSAALRGSRAGFHCGRVVSSKAVSATFRPPVTAPTQTGLQVQGVHLWRGERHVLRGVHLDAPLGTFWHVRGPNGAGKTSLLRVVAGFLWPEDGKVVWNGQETRHLGDEFGAQMACLGHEPALKADLSARENIRYLVGLRRAVADAEMDAAFVRLGIADHADRPTRMLSAGQKRRAAMVRVLLSNASLWLLDEPFTNLDVAGVELFAGLLAEHAAGGGVVLATTHQPIPALGVRTLELA